MKSDLLNNYDKIYIAGDFNYPSVRWDGERSNSKDNEFVECVRDVYLTQTVKKKMGIEKDIPLICRVALRGHRLLGTGSTG